MGTFHLGATTTKDLTRSKCVSTYRQLLNILTMISALKIIDRVPRALVSITTSQYYPARREENQKPGEII